MPHQFEPQTEQQTRPYTPPDMAAPSTSTPACAASEAHNTETALPIAEAITPPAQEQTFVSTVGRNWQSLLQQWQQESRKCLRRNALQAGGVVIGISLLSLLAAFSNSPLLPAPRYNFLFLLWGISCVFLGVPVYAATRKLNSKQRAILEALATVEDVSATGPLLEAWQAAATNGQGREEFGNVLLRLLPRLRLEDGTKLTLPQRRILHDNIGHNKALYHPDMALACLTAIEQIGDTHALPHLARLVAHDAPSQKEQRIRERARHCLTHLTHTLDFGTTADIPGWIAKLPYGPIGRNQPTLPSGADEALIALFALLRLLPQIQSSDTDLLKASQRECLAESWVWMIYALYPVSGASGSMQQSRLGSDFPSAVLGALEQIGTGRDLGLSRWLLRDVPMDELPQLREKARHVDAILKQRRDKEQAGHTLLRGASAPTAAPGELLRPASAAQTHSDPKELLRPQEIRDTR